MQKNMNTHTYQDKVEEAEKAIITIELSDKCGEYFSSFQNLCVELFSRPLTEEQCKIMADSMFDNECELSSDPDEIEEGMRKMVEFLEHFQSDIENKTGCAGRIGSGTLACERITVNSATLQKILDCEKTLAEKIGTAANAKFCICGETLWHYGKVVKYINEFTEMST